MKKRSEMRGGRSRGGRSRGVSLYIYLYYNSVRASVCVFAYHSTYSSETNARIFTKFSQIIADVVESAQFFFGDDISKNDVTRAEKVT